MLGQLGSDVIRRMGLETPWVSTVKGRWLGRAAAEHFFHEAQGQFVQFCPVGRQLQVIGGVAQ
jgi:hypothetical protein